MAGVDELPLLAGQTSIWVAEQFGTAGNPYNIAFGLGFDRDQVSAPQLTSVVDTLVDTHRCLHARVIDDRGLPRQRFDARPHIETVEQDRDDVTSRASALRDHRFDLGEGPLSRFEVVTTPTGTHLLSCQHHVVWDGASRAIAIDDVSAMVEGRDPAPSMPYAEALSACLELERQAEPDAEAVLDALAAAGPVDPAVDEETDGYGSAVRISPTLATAVAGFVDRGGSHGGLVLAAATAALDLDAPRLAGVVVSTRPAPHARVAGCFVNTVPVVVTPDLADPGAAGAALRQAQRTRHLPLRVLTAGARRRGLPFRVDERLLVSFSAVTSRFPVRLPPARGNRIGGITFRYWDVNGEVMLELEHTHAALTPAAADGLADRFLGALTALSAPTS